MNSDAFVVIVNGRFFRITLNEYRDLRTGLLKWEARVAENIGVNGVRTYRTIECGVGAEGRFDALTEAIELVDRVVRDE